jgi:Domain of unknown function (DUF4129)
VAASARTDQAPDGLGATSSSIRGVIVATATIGLSFIVALGSRSVSFPPSEPDPTSPSAPRSLIGYAILLAAPVVVAGILALVIVLFPQGRSSTKQAQKRANLFARLPWWLRIIAVTGAMALVAIPIGLAFQATRGSPSRPEVQGPISIPSVPGESAPPESVTAPARPDWAIAIVAIVSASGLTAFLVARRRRTTTTDAPATTQRAAHVHRAIVDSISDLRGERDARRAVIAAYARMEHDLSGVGIPRRTSETPFEYLDRVLTHSGVISDAVTELTGLFQRAKFGGGSVDEQMKLDAIASLERMAAETAGT